GTPLTFLFPGQGAQFPDMLKDLAIEFSEVADCFAHADAVLGNRYDRRLSQYVFPPPAFSEEDRTRAAQALKATNITQPALGVCGLALVRLLASFKIKPALTAGHSYGELVALCTAGSLDEASLYELSWARADAMLGASASNQGDLGTMIAVQGDQQRVRPALAGCDEIWTANHNSPQQIVFSGTKRGMAQAAQALEAVGISYMQLAVSCAFHSPLMAPARARFEQALQAIDFQPPAFPVYSNVSATAH